MARGHQGFAEREDGVGHPRRQHRDFAQHFQCGRGIAIDQMRAAKPHARKQPAATFRYGAVEKRNRALRLALRKKGVGFGQNIHGRSYDRTSGG
jgi:hypothetical protein